jgi:hypothetical protein
LSFGIFVDINYGLMIFCYIVDGCHINHIHNLSKKIMDLYGRFGPIKLFLY